MILSQYLDLQKSSVEAGGPGSGRRPGFGVGPQPGASATAHPNAHNMLVNKGFEHRETRPTASGKISYYQHPSSGKTAQVDHAGNWRLGGRYQGKGMGNLYLRLKE